MKYPKILTAFKRDENFKVKLCEWSHPAFQLINKWFITEKIDGMNVRVHWDSTEQKVNFKGRTDAAQLPAPLLEYLTRTFTPDVFKENFPSIDVWLFGEGYGPGIQRNGGRYRPDQAVRLFDVALIAGRVWWQEWSRVEETAQLFHVKTVPVVLPDASWAAFIELGLEGYLSPTAALEGDSTLQAEGIVARTNPLLFDRKGDRIMFKLKRKDRKVS